MMTAKMRGAASLVPVVVLLGVLAYVYGTGLIGASQALQHSAALTTVSGIGIYTSMRKSSDGAGEAPRLILVVLAGMILGGIQYAASYFV